MFLAAPLGSRSQAQRLIAEGHVRVDGRAAQKGHRIRAASGSSSRRSRPRPPLPAAGVPVAEFAIAYEDDHLIVVDKPAGVVVHPARGHREGTLAQALAGRAAGGEQDWRAGIVHRLDRDTSGLLVVAKSDEVHRRLKAALAARDIRREYLALVEGRPPARSGTIEAPIGRDRRHRTRMSIDTDAPKPAITHFAARARARAGDAPARAPADRAHAPDPRPPAGDRPSRCAATPSTGTAGLYGLERQFLHATRLAFAHPITGEPLDVVSPLPADLERALELAAGDG